MSIFKKLDPFAAGYGEAFIAALMSLFSVGVCVLCFQFLLPQPGYQPLHDVIGLFIVVAVVCMVTSVLFWRNERRHKREIRRMVDAGVLSLELRRQSIEGAY